MDNSAIKWLIDHGHKILIWIQFLVAVVVWIAADPDPSVLLELLQSCLAQ